MLCLLRQCGRRCIRCSLCLLLLFKHGLEIDFRQMDRWKTSPLNQISHVAAQIGVNDLWAGNAHNLSHLIFRHIADLKYPRLFCFHQEDCFVLDFGVHRSRYADLKNTLGYGCCFNAKLNIHSRLLLLQQNRWRIRLLKRSLLKVHTLNLENGRLF